MTAETVVVERNAFALSDTRTRLKTVFESEDVFRSLGKILFFVLVTLTTAIGHDISSACGNLFYLERDCSGHAGTLAAIAGKMVAKSTGGVCDAIALF
jgi:hypothetical protein